MNKADVKLLIVNDADMNCDIAKDTIDNMSIANVSFVKADLDRFDMIIYVGAKGSKILKSKHTPLGRIIR